MRKGGQERKLEMEREDARHRRLVAARPPGQDYGPGEAVILGCVVLGRTGCVDGYHGLVRCASQADPGCYWTDTGREASRQMGAFAEEDPAR